MSDLVERLRHCAAKMEDYGRPKYSATLLEAVAALEAAQDRIEAVRRETVTEVSALILARAAEHGERQTVHYAYGNDRMGECSWAKRVEAVDIAAAIRALTEARKEK